VSINFFILKSYDKRKSIDFYLENFAYEYDEKIEGADLREELQKFLYKNKERFCDEIEVLLKLDPYGDVILKEDEIKKICSLGDTVLRFNQEMLKEYDNSVKEEEEKASSFFIEIKKICEKALSENRTIIAIGD
jgi:hypothetical protein